MNFAQDLLGIDCTRRGLQTGSLDEYPALLVCIALGLGGFFPITVGGVQCSRKYAGRLDQHEIERVVPYISPICDRSGQCRSARKRRKSMCGLSLQAKALQIQVILDTAFGAPTCRRAMYITIVINEPMERNIANFSDQLQRVCFIYM